MEDYGFLEPAGWEEETHAALPLQDWKAFPQEIESYPPCIESENQRAESYVFRTCESSGEESVLIGSDDIVF